jgi:hypothetical protein
MVYYIPSSLEVFLRRRKEERTLEDIVAYVVSISMYICICGKKMYAAHHTHTPKPPRALEAEF